MIVNENSQKSTDDNETVRKLKDELNQVSIQNIEIREMVETDYKQQIFQLKESLARESANFERANSEIQNLRSKIESQDHSLNVLTAKITDQQTELTEIQKANVVLRSKEINADIQAHQKDQEFTEIKEENDFLKAQVRKHFWLFRSEMCSTNRFFFQLDVYKSDFEMERQSRQDIANEREELLSDLKLLQRRNQQLIDEAQSRYLFPQISSQH